MDEQAAQTTSETTTDVEQSQELQESTDVETQHESDEQAQSAPEGASTEAPESAPQPTEAPQVEEEPEWTPQPLEQPKVDTPDIRHFVDADGNLDLATYSQAQQQWAAQVVQAAAQAAAQVGTQQTAYQREWGRAEDKYPELKNNKQLKDMVQAIHANSAQPGFKYVSPLKAAEQLFALRGEAKSEGMKAAKEVRTVQAAAGLANPNPPAPSQPTNKLTQLKTTMKTGGTRSERQGATQQYIAELIKAGRL